MALLRLTKTVSQLAEPPLPEWNQSLNPPSFASPCLSLSLFLSLCFFPKSLRSELKCGGVAVGHSLRHKYATAASLEQSAPSFLFTLNVRACVCVCHGVCVRKCPTGLLLDVTLCILLSGAHGAFAKVLSLVCNKHIGRRSQPATGCVS